MKKIVSTRVQHGTYKKLKELAQSKKLSLSALCRNYLRQFTQSNQRDQRDQRDQRESLEAENQALKERLKPLELYFEARTDIKKVMELQKKEICYYKAHIAENEIRVNSRVDQLKTRISFWWGLCVILSISNLIFYLIFLFI